MNKIKILSLSVMAAASQLSVAGTDIFFNPLTQSAPVATPNSGTTGSHFNEVNHPWVTPAGISQVNLTSMSEIEADAAQSVVRVPGLSTGASMWDMVAYDETGEYIFIPHETAVGAGATRYSVENDTAEVIFAGNLGGAEGDWSSDWGAFDPSTFTPNGSLMLGEEWSGEGKIMEILNPKAAVEDIEYRELESIANVSHEGLRFSADGNTLYYVDEWNSGSLYKIDFTTPGDYTSGQTFVLSVDAFNGVASDLWSDASNSGATRTGAATWIPLTDVDGNPVTLVDPFANGPTNDPRSNDDTRGGRPAADEVGATPYGRPEDMEVGTLANGNEVVYFAATSERTIYSVEILSSTEAYVREFASDANTPKNLGFPETTAELNSPDNLAQDALGNIYIIEDAPNRSDRGGDIWFVRDVDSDGVAESVDHFLSISADGAEATGMIFNPVNPTEFVVAVQHPDSTELLNFPEGQGDALWKFDLSGVVPPVCGDSDRTFNSKIGKSVKTCNRSFTNFVKALEYAK